MTAGRPARGPISDLNVTPMADVMIVLLIIFMVTIPRLVQEVDLPEAAHARDRSGRRLAVTVRQDGKVSAAGVGVELADLEAHLRGRLAVEGGVVDVRAAVGLAYVDVSRVLDAVRAAGAEEVALVVEEKR
jgi:biopolymer transport protein ExbD